MEDFIVSNVVKKRSYYNKTLGVWVKKPRVNITNENYKYLELLDKVRYNKIDFYNTLTYIKENNLNEKEIEKYIIFKKNILKKS